ncbi:hypothetical protein TNCV_1139001 [Trichonephila clavipes]|nr:hypothetical protein TNCV_1139001 [Trichonephila clavipes]
MPSEQRGMSPKERKGSPKTVRTPETVERINVSIQTGKYNEDIVINGIWIHLKKYLLIDVVSLEALQFSPFLNFGVRKRVQGAEMTQGPSESVQEFAARINKLGTQIFQSGNSAQNTAVRNANDQLLQSRFISGLRNDIRRFVLSRDPLNLDESINAALIEEQNMKLNQIASEERSGLSSAQTENPVLSALADR